jgi:tetratricopeptide (TPR) repeat protein
MIAWLEAMRGNVSEARALYARSRAIFEEFGLKRWIAGYAVYSGPTELVAGDFVRAEEELRRGFDLLQELGDRGVLSPVAAFLAQAVYAQGRYDEADELASVSEECASRDDLFPHVVWRGVRAKVLARRGALEAASDLAREAVGLAEQTDCPYLQGDAWSDLAEVLRAAGDDAEANYCNERALRLQVAKGDVVSAARTRAQLAQIGGPA